MHDKPPTARGVRAKSPGCQVVWDESRPRVPCGAWMSLTSHQTHEDSLCLRRQNSSQFTLRNLRIGGTLWTLRGPGKCLWRWGAKGTQLMPLTHWPVRPLRAEAHPKLEETLVRGRSQGLTCDLTPDRPAWSASL